MAIRAPDGAKKNYSKFCDILWQVLRNVQINCCRFSEKGNFSEEAQAKLTGMGGGFDPRWISRRLSKI